MSNNFIKERRKELGLTLEQIGDYVGVGKSTVKKWESGAIKNMRRDKIIKLSQILKVSPLDIMNSSELVDKCIKDVELNPEETNLINIYRVIDDNGRKMINNVAELEYERCKKWKWHTMPTFYNNKSTNNTCDTVWHSAI